MQHITTRYLGPTDHRGSRIKATTSYGKDSITIGYPYELSGIDCHVKAVKELIKKVKWNNDLDRTRMIYIHHENGYLFAFDNDLNSIDI